MTKTEILADITSQAITVGAIDATGDGGLPNITRYTVHTAVLTDGKICHKEFNFWVYREGTVDEIAYYVV